MAMRIMFLVSLAFVTVTAYSLKWWMQGNGLIYAFTGVMAFTVSLILGYPYIKFQTKRFLSRMR